MGIGDWGLGIGDWGVGGGGGGGGGGGAAPPPPPPRPQTRNPVLADEVNDCADSKGQADHVCSA